MTRMQRVQSNRRAIERIAKRYVRLYLSATPTQLEDGTLWYPRALTSITGLAEAAGVELEVAIKVVAALSPRIHWSRNLKVAGMMLHDPYTKPAGTLSRSFHAAQMIMLKDNQLSGQKVIQFADALSGNEDAVVVDVWMMRAAGYTKEAPTANEYRIVTEATRVAARRVGVSARTMQATVWIAMRGRA